MIKSTLSIVIFFVFIHALMIPESQSQSDRQYPIITVDDFGFEMVYVPTGNVQMGIDIDTFSDLVTTSIFSEFGGRTLISLQADSGVFEVYETTVQGFWMDRYEVSVDDYERIVLQCFSTNTCSDNHLPQLLTWNEAVSFCAARGARLPMESEWEYAASGSENLIFPWGNELVTDSIDYQEYIGFDLYNVGGRSLNISWTGVFDLAGNAEEWTNDLFRPYYSWNETTFVDWYEVYPEFSRVLRGGDASDSFMNKTTYSRQGGFYGIAGFRCVQISHPNKR